MIMKREEEIRNKAISEQRELMESCDWRAGFIAGANWADSQSYSKQQLREMGFVFDLNGNVLSPNHLAEKAAHYVIEKTCEWLDNIDTDDYMVSGIFQMSDLIIDLKKAMKS